MNKLKNYCCLVSHQLDLANPKENYQLNSFFTKLAINLLQAIKKAAKLCPLCENALTNLKDFSKREAEVKKAKSLLTHQDLVEEIVKRVEKGAMPASDSLWTNLLYLYSQRDWEVCFGDQRWGFKGFDIPDKFFFRRNKEVIIKSPNSNNEPTI